MPLSFNYSPRAKKTGFRLRHNPSLSLYCRHGHPLGRRIERCVVSLLLLELGVGRAVMLDGGINREAQSKRTHPLCLNRKAPPPTPQPIPPLLLLGVQWRHLVGKRATHREFELPVPRQLQDGVWEPADAKRSVFLTCVKGLEMSSPVLLFVAV